MTGVQTCALPISKSHLHKIMEEVYYVEKGKGKMTIGDKIFPIGPGDVFPIPKNTYHSAEGTPKNPLTILVVTHPRYSTSDVYEESVKR